MLDQRPTKLRAFAVAHFRNIGGKNRRSLAVGFFMPWLAAIVLVGMPDRGLAQIGGSDPLSVLQQMCSVAAWVRAALVV